MSGVQMRPEEILDEIQRLFPLEFRVSVLSITNRKQGEIITAQDEIIEGQRRVANDDAWRKEDGKS